MYNRKKCHTKYFYPTRFKPSHTSGSDVAGRTNDFSNIKRKKDNQKPSLHSIANSLYTTFVTNEQRDRQTSNQLYNDAQTSGYFVSV